MGFIRSAVKRRVTVAMCFLCIVLLGVVSFTNIGLDLFPAIEMPMSMVYTTYNGAGSEEVETMVTEPLEEAFSSLQNVDSIQSQSSAGLSMVMVTYNYGTDLDFASLNMREKIDLVKDYLPEDADTPTIYRMSMNSMPVMIMAVSGSGSLADLKTTVENEIVPEIESCEGVASVETGGGLTEAVTVDIDETVLENYGLTLDNIVSTIKANNVNMAAGSIVSNNKDMTIRVLGQYDSLADIENTNIVLPSGISVLLKDIADISVTTTADAMKVRQDGNDAIYFAVTKASDANTVSTTENVNRVMDSLQNSLPEGTVINKVFDQGDYVTWTIDSLKNSLLIGALLAVLILLVFLRSIRSTLVIAVSIPISLISTFVLMYFTGMTINIMTLGGLSLGAGMMVDSSIVILENIQRYISAGMSREDAAVKGTKELIMAVVASTLTTVAVFLPVVFMQGMVSMFFKDLALTITFALLASLVVAVTLVPMLSAQLLRPEMTKEEKFAEKKPNLFVKLQYMFGDGYEKLKSSYKVFLGWSLDHRKRIIIAVTVLFVAALASLGLVGMEFIPASETGQLNVAITMEDGISEEAAEETTAVADQAIQAVCGDDLVSSLVLIEDNTATVYVNLKDKEEREVTANEYGEKVREALGNIAGIEYSVAVGDMMTSSMTGMGGGGAAVTINVKGDDLEEIKKICERVQNTMESIPGAREIKSSMEDSVPELHITLNYNKAAALGLTVPTITSAINTYLDGTKASTYSMGDGTEIDIDVNYAADAESTYNDLLNMPVTAANGATYLLSDVAEIEVGEGPVSISREDSKRLATVTCSLVGVDLNTYTNELNAALADYALPSGYEVYSGGMFEEMMDSFSALGLGAILAIVLVYMVMAALFESFLQPFIILFTLPTAFIGVMLGIFITGTTMNVVTLIGIVMLIGIVVNNGIVLVDYVNTLRREDPDMSCREALMIAGPLRLRPILMTALTTILAMIPMAVSQAEGAEMSRGMAIAVSFGLTASTFFTLVFVPVVYSIVDERRQNVSNKKSYQKLKNRFAEVEVKKRESGENQDEI
ncbi:MAG: efflux RND transporter permease subunit [Bacillota bacterium]|jgi:HAE1 family hydrophobic/amphiphilic exporter-1